MTTTAEAPAAPQVWASADLTLTPSMTLNRGDGDHHPKPHRAYDIYFGGFLTDMDRMVSGGLYGVKFFIPRFNADTEEISVGVQFATEAGSKVAAALERWDSLPTEDITPQDIDVANRTARDLSYEAEQVLLERARAAGFSLDMRVTEVERCLPPTQDD